MRYVGLTKYPANGEAPSEEHFDLFEAAAQELGDGDVLVETLRISVDPYLRGCMTGDASYILPQFEIGGPIKSMGVGRVVESNDPSLAPGDVVTGILDWADVALWSGRDYLVGEGALKVLSGAAAADPSAALGVLGLSGTTAYFGVLSVAQPKPGETILISGAAGGVGTVAGQIAKLQGARVFGLASSEEKRRVLTDRLGFEAAFDYRAPDFAEQLAAALPEGPDVYFDNVGGETSQTVMWGMSKGARVVECGQIATLGDSDREYKVDITPIHMKGLKFEGYATPHYFEFMPGAEAQLAAWLEEGKLVSLESAYDGLEQAPTAMAGLHRGTNLGKSVVVVAD